MDLSEDLIELYDLFCTENKIKEEISDLRSELRDVKESMAELKLKVIKGLKEKDYKFAQYKDMTATLHKRPTKIKLEKDKISDLIEKIIDMDIDTPDKRLQILNMLKPRESGDYIDYLSIKKTKK